VKKRTALHGTDLAVAEETTERHVAECRPEHVGVVVRPSIEVLAPAETREEQ
jgi:hypothetical protein